MTALPKRILVIDDDEAILSLIVDALSPAYHVVTAADWLHGTTLLFGEQFDALLVDLSMPVFDGLEFINKMRAEPQHSATPVIVMSAYPDLRERLSNANVQAILAKPFGLDDLDTILHETLNKPSADGDGLPRLKHRPE